MFGDLKYPAGFKRFDYVNPDAPKGGVVRLIALGTFDNFNVVINGLKGSIAGGVALIYESLMAEPNDEVSSMYCLLAEQVTHPDDRSFVKFRLNPDARWHDGKPITPDDVVFSFDAFKQYSAMQRAYYRHVVKAETDRRATKSPSRSTARAIANCRPSSASSRSCPSIGGKARMPQGHKRDITATTLEIPLGSGPYRVKEFSAGPFADAGAGQGLLGREDPGQCRPEQFRPDSL